MTDEQENRFAAQNRWFATVPEVALEPDLPICDPHFHLWHHPGNRYLAEEYLSDIQSGHNVVSSVYIDCVSAYRTDGPEALRPVGEVEFVEAERARATELGAAIGDAIVGFADLRLGAEVGEVLDMQLSVSPRFRGIRFATTWDSSPQIRQAHTEPGGKLMANPAFLEGFAELARRDLSFDAWAYHPQLLEVVALAKQFPDTTIIVDHLGGFLGIGPYTDQHDEVFQNWQGSITQLAQCPNVAIKLGGACMPITGRRWNHRELPPSSSELEREYARYFMHAIESFGVERCMFESNFPYDRFSVSFNVLWNFYKQLTQGFSSDERAQLFHDTATRVYRVS